MALEISGIAANGMALNPHAQVQKPVVRKETAPVEVLRPPKIDPEMVEKSVREIEKLSGYFNRQLKFSVNRELNQVVVKVIDGETDKIIKVLPPEELQRLHLRIREAIGLLFDEKI